MLRTRRPQLRLMTTQRALGKTNLITLGLGATTTGRLARTITITTGAEQRTITTHFSSVASRHGYLPRWLQIMALQPSRLITDLKRISICMLLHEWMMYSFSLHLRLRAGRTLSRCASLV